MAVVVIGALLSFLLTRLIARVIILVVVIVLGVFVWQQRNHVRDDVNTHACNLNATFFGVHVNAPDVGAAGLPVAHQTRSERQRTRRRLCR